MLSAALESLIGQETAEEFSYDISVIDDRSTDQTSEVVKDIARRSPVPIRYVREEGKGISHARNRGIKESSGKWIAFYGDDQIVDLSGHNAEIIRRKCLPRRALGYTYRTLYLPAPRFLPQERFFARIDFRKERKTFSKDPRS